MFLSEKITELRSMGATVAQINKFKDAYSEKMREGAAPAAAMELAEKNFLGSKSDKPEVKKVKK